MAAKPSPKAGEGPASYGRFYGALDRLARHADAASSHRRRAYGMVEEVSALLHGIAAARAATVDLNATDLQVLIMLWLGSPERTLKASEIQRALGFTAGGVTRRLDSLAMRGLIERLADPDDGRAWLVRLTPAGAEIIAGPLASNVSRNRQVEETFSDAEWRTLNALLERLAASLSDAGDD